MDRSDQAQVFLHKAEADQAALFKLSEDKEIADEVLGFHAQQAVEKALKAVCCGLDIEPPRTHDLELIKELIGRAGCELPGYLDQIAELSPFAVEFRYGDPTEDELLDRPATVELVGHVVDWCRNQL